MERTETTLIDDLTGMRLVQSTRVTMIIDVGGKQEDFTLDFDPDTLAAFMAAIRDHEWEPIRRLFAGEPAAKPAKPAATAGEPTGKEINAWLKSIGREVKRGNPSKELRDEYLAAHR